MFIEHDYEEEDYISVSPKMAAVMTLALGLAIGFAVGLLFAVW